MTGFSDPPLRKFPPAPSSSRRAPERARRRILVVDDNRSIHDDFRKILVPRAQPRELSHLRAELFGEPVAEVADPFDVEFASQGDAGCVLTERALLSNRPFSLAFVDMRMPPGIDGVETTVRLLALQASLRVVICSAYSDFSWRDVLGRVRPDGLRLLPKPFSAKQVLDLAWELTAPLPNP